MRRATTLYWIFTGLAAAFMLMASIPDVLQLPAAVDIFKHLGFPPYLLPFIGLAKIAGVVVILLPMFQNLKEWAYAGLVFDLIGAFYSHLSVGDHPGDWLFAIVGLLLVLFSYAFYRWKMTCREVTRRVSKRNTIAA
jgi:DoxX-like family